jgi:DNA-directed RNA polymerase I and III subunit RPAC1
MFNKIEINPNSLNRLKFTIKDIDLSIVNAIRRIILSELPNIAFYFDPYDTENNDIEILVNSSSLHNEFLSHRISLIPVHFTENEVENFKPENYKFSLKIKNTSDKTINITTKDIKIKDNEGNEYLEKLREHLFPINKITNDYILITKLKPNLYDPEKGEEINIEFKGSINIAKNHSRWCATSQCCFYNEIDYDVAEKVFKEKVSAVEKLEEKELSHEKIADLRLKFNALDQYKNFKKNKYDEPNEFIFQIESECRLRPTYLFFKGLKILISKLENFIINLSANNDSIIINQLGNVDNFYQISIKNEDHTLLNTLQCLIYKQNFQGTDGSNFLEKSLQKNKVLDYIGYYQPHPLDNLIYLKLKFNADIKANNEYTKIFMIDSIKNIIIDLHKILKEWITKSKLNESDIKEILDYMK